MYKIIILAILTILISMSTGCLITSQRVAGRRAAITPMIINGNIAISTDILQWSKTEKIIGIFESIGWAGLAAIVIEYDRKSSSTKNYNYNYNYNIQSESGDININSK